MPKEFISYAQNFEDVILWRALKSYPPGRYVDVGANDPLLDSVTKAFYDRGWRGVNVEADTDHFEKLQEQRDQDTNVQVFVGSEEGEVEFFRILRTGLSTFRQDFAEQHRQAGHEVVATKVPVRTLDSVLDETTIGNDEFHFLKVDVEGAEGAVFQGLDLALHRPWIIVVEATEPNSTVESYDSFEKRILAHRYDFVYFDGLSRFYVAEEKPELRPAFTKPPNFFDEFVLWETVSARRLAQQLQEVVEPMKAALEESRSKVQELKASKRFQKDTAKIAQRLHSAVQDLYGSPRWRWGSLVTRPLSRHRDSGFAPLDKALASLNDLLTRLDSPPADPGSVPENDPADRER